MKKRLLRLLSRIWIRLLAFNFLLVFLPVAALSSLKSTELYLLKLQEDSNIQQARLLAAALGGHETLDSKEAGRIIRNLNRQTDARLRIIDAELNLLADSSRFGPRADAAAAASEEDDDQPEVQDTWLYRLGQTLFQLYAKAFLPPRRHSPSSDFYATAEKIDGEEIREALEGEYGGTTRLSKDRTAFILYSAIPIKSGPEVLGVALVSKSTYSVRQRIYNLRLHSFKVMLISVGVAIVLSLLVSATIALPIGRLRNQALAILDRRGRLKGRFKVYRRLDEIGDLSRSLNELTSRLEQHISFIESFASDVSHEFKNPLASIRNAADLIAEVEDPIERKRFHEMALKDLARLEKLLTSVRDITKIDAQIDEQPEEKVRLDEMLRGLVEQFEMRRERGLRYHLDLPARAVEVRVEPYRLAQVFENLLDNARSFSPEGGEVHVSLDIEEKRAVARVTDQGPGIPDEHLERIFSRFFSYRPDGAESGNGHTGLGLSIVRAIVEGAGGRVQGKNAPGGGAVLEVQLPLAA